MDQLKAECAISHKSTINMHVTIFGDLSSLNTSVGAMSWVVSST